MRSSVTGTFQFETILKVGTEFGENGGLRGGAEVPGHDNGKFSMLGSYFPQGIKQVLKLFTVDKAECMEIFPAGGEYRSKRCSKGSRLMLMSRIAKEEFFRYPVYNQTGCVRDALGWTNLTVPYNDRATSYLLDIRGSTENAVGKFECSVIVAAALDENDICTEFGYLFNGRGSSQPSYKVRTLICLASGDGGIL